MNSYRIFTYLCLLLAVPFWGARGDEPKKKTGPPIVDGLKALKHADANVRYRAIQTLIDLGPLAKFATPALREMLQDKHPQVRVKAAEALWKIDQTPAAALLPVLLDALKDKNANVRAAAPPVIALIGAKARPAVPALIAALKDKEYDVKVSVIVALGDLGSAARDAAGPLLDLTEDEANFFPPESKEKVFLLEPFVGAALTNLGPGTIPILTQGLGDKSADRRRVSAYALGSMGPKAASASGDLARALRHDDPATRQLAARALGKIGPAAKSALSPLETALTDKVATVRIEAALATWFIMKQPKNLGVLVKALNDESISVRDSACQALAVMKAGAKDAAEPVAKLLDHKELRIRAIITLGEIGPPASDPTVAKLKTFLDDKDGETQLWSAFALWQLTGHAKDSLKVLKQTLATEKYYTQSIVQLGEMGEAAQPLLPTLVNLYREEDIVADRLALANAIKKIDPTAAKKLGIK